MPDIMLNVTSADGEESLLPAEIGASLMEALRNIGFVEAVCGGQAACATCHVFIDRDWFALTGTAQEQEQDLLDSSLERLPNSRLSCQIVATPELDGLRLTVAPPEG